MTDGPKTFPTDRQTDRQEKNLKQKILQVLSFGGSQFPPFTVNFGPHLQRFVFFVAYKWPNKLECYITIGWKGLTRTNPLS